MKGALKILVLAGAVVAAQIAAAQEDAGPLRFLRPSVEPAEPNPPAEAAAPEGVPEAARVEAAPGEAAPAPAGPGQATLEQAAPVQAAPGQAEGDPTAPAMAPDAPAAVEAPPTLRLGVIAGRDVAATREAAGRLAEGLGQAIGRPVEILPMSTYGAMVDAQGLGRIDGGFYSSAAYAAAQAQCACLEPLVAPRASDGTAAYHAVIVAAAGSGLAGIADLQGKTVAAAAADSVAGRRLQLAALLAEGVDVETAFGAVLDAGSSEEAVRLVLSGAADAAFAWMSFPPDGDLYARGTLADMVRRGELAGDALEVIWRSPPLFHGPVAVKRSLSEAEKSAMEAYLLALEGTSPDIYDQLNPYYAGGYVAVEPQDYGGAELLAENDVDRLRLPGPPEARARPAAAETPAEAPGASAAP